MTGRSTGTRIRDIGRAVIEENREALDLLSDYDHTDTCEYSIPDEQRPCGKPAVAFARPTRHGHKGRRVPLCAEHVERIQKPKTPTLILIREQDSL